MNSRRHLGPMERVLYLRTLEEFEGLSSAELAGVAEHARERFFGAGSLLMEEGEPASSFFILVEGEVDVGREGKIFSRLGPREAVGLMSLLSRDEMSIEARAASDVLCFEFNAEMLTDTLEENFTVVRSILRNAGHRYLRLFRHLPQDTRIDSGAENPACPVRALDLVERIVVLRKTAVFRQTSLEALAALSRQMTERRYEAGTVLWREGDRGGQIHLVICGGAECVSRADATSFRVGPGFPLGVVEAYAGEDRWYEATTDEHTVTFEFDSEVLIDLMEDHHGMALDVLSAFASRILQLWQIVGEVGRATPAADIS